MTTQCQECERPAVARNLCSKHYMRQRRRQNGGIGRKQIGAHDAEILLDAYDSRDKFNQRVGKQTNAGCIEWAGTRNNAGYGMLYLNGRDHLAHRVAYVLNNNAAIGQVIMHSCDNPVCVNPAHLSAGSHSDNMQDMHSKGRANTVNSGKHLKDRANHPRNRAVDTPKGRFASAALAADAYGVSARYVQRMAAEMKDGFSYAIRQEANND